MSNARLVDQLRDIERDDDLYEQEEREFAGVVADHIDSLEKALVELVELHLCDDDEHNLNCQKGHGKMILPNPEGCVTCRIFGRVSLPSPQAEVEK